MNQDGRRILVPLLGPAALVLLIGCGNGACLLLVRGLQWQQGIDYLRKWASEVLISSKAAADAACDLSIQDLDLLMIMVF